MAIGVLNLWDITDELIQLLNSHKGGANFTVTDRSPDEIRNLLEDTYLSLYLFHVSPDKFHRNTLPIASGNIGERTNRAFLTPHQPLSLNLHYLLTAYAKGVDASRNEQQAMTAALKCFHEQPIVTATIPDDNHPVEFTLTLEPETADEVGRLWQAITASLRLSAIYKVSVVLIEPPSPLPAFAKKPDTINLAVSPTSLPFASTGQVISTYIRVNYIAPENKLQSYELIPAVVAPGQSFTLHGAGLNQSSSDRLYLLFPNGTEEDITPWILEANELRLLVNLPLTSILPAGVYQVRVGNAVAIANPGAIRSNATPFSIAALVDSTEEPILTPANSTYTLNGQGFSPGTVEVLLETVPLTLEQFTVNNTAINFQLPDNLPNGVYGVRVRVNQVESHPAKWVVKS
ncbi:DUF4255 domain-containing protein [Nostoc sp. WHI]|uniref:DUF4255 domain-containing protein n=1 Tax=Nostoc sp. WHI TaxID=2650611 RepID=UPI0018C5ED18|nr:DUF4255 domain-containing protein [Nostoc sp. WHI]MBG1270888.1 DUF4255 domain-containing protein [Nostoc sp. WHI]